MSIHQKCQHLSPFFFLPDAPFIIIYSKTTWNANTRAKNKEITKEVNENLSANRTSFDIEANHSGTLDTKMKLIANVSADDVHGKNISSSQTVEAYEGFDLILTLVIESYPPVSNQHWTKPTKVKNNDDVTMYQESYSMKDTRLEITSYVSSDLTKTYLKSLGHFTLSLSFDCNDVFHVTGQRRACCCGAFVRRTVAHTHSISPTPSSVVLRTLIYKFIVRDI